MSGNSPSTAFSHSGLPALRAMAVREVTRFVRQPSRIVAALGTALLLWLLFGSGFAAFSTPTTSEDTGPASYALFLLPGMATMVVLFSSIFAAMSLIDDRHAGFLQSVLVSPAPRWSIVGGKVIAGAVLALVQAVILLPAAPLLGATAGLTDYLLALVALGSISIGLTGLGLAAAWWIDSSQGFHGIMNLVLMPMWLLSGSVFAFETASPWLRAIMLADPLFWPVSALRNVLVGSPLPASPEVVWLLTLAFGVGGFLLGTGVGRVAQRS